MQPLNPAPAPGATTILHSALYPCYDRPGPNWNPEHMRYHLAALLYALAASAVALALGQMLTAIVMLPFGNLARSACADIVRWAPGLVVFAFFSAGAAYLLHRR